MKRLLTLTALGLALAQGAAAQDAAAAYADIEKTLGAVPDMFTVFPEAGIAGAWDEFKSVQDALKKLPKAKSPSA